jgi:hypothetical protein
MKFDNPLKEILQDAMPALLRLLALPQAAKYLTVEFPLHNRVVPDLVVLLADERVLHTELQVKNELQFEWRCLDYYSAIRQQLRPRKIVQVVVHVGHEPLTIPDRIEDDTLTFRFQILNLAEVPAQAFLDSPSDAERMLAMLCATENPRETIRQILASWKHLHGKPLRELLDRMTVLSQLRKYDRMIREEVERMPFEIDITENAFYIDGKADGIEEGAAEGEARGEARGEAKTLLRFLEQRFGPVPAPIRERVFAAGIEDLDRWVDAMPTAASLDEVFAT